MIGWLEEPTMMSVIPVLTTREVTDQGAIEEAFERAISEGAFDHTKYIMGSDLKDQCFDLFLSAESLPFSSYNNFEEVARGAMMAPIGTSIRLLEESGWIKDIGLVHHCIGLMRLSGPYLWRIIDVRWLATERCPLTL
jgi:hypothetical protein